eukprot:364955-Chlamydomonas_euryale.AAC.2
MIVKGAEVDSVMRLLCLKTSAAIWEQMLWHAHATTSWTKPYHAPQMRIFMTAMRLFGMYLPEPPSTHTYTRAYAHRDPPDGEVMPSE